MKSHTSSTSRTKYYAASTSCGAPRRFGTGSSSKSTGKRKRPLGEGYTLGGSQSSSTSASPKKRAKTTSGEPGEEKRLARWKPKPPQNILDRVERVMMQRFFMISRERDGKELKESFHVLGSTGNVYTVTITHMPSCTCPDAMKGNHCKHILFVYLKVLHVPHTSSYWYQKALLTSELQEIFDSAPVAPNSVANARMREALNQALGKPSTSKAAESSSKRRMPTEEDDCPICYEKMHDVDQNKLKFCEECGNAIHQECFQQWKLSTIRDAGKSLTCVYCRAKWSEPSSTPGSSRHGMQEGYINLSQVAGVSPRRDTSTYYRGRFARNYDDEFFIDLT